MGDLVLYFVVVVCLVGFFVTMHHYADIETWQCNDCGASCTCKTGGLLGHSRLRRSPSCGNESIGYVSTKRGETK